MFISGNICPKCGGYFNPNTLVCTSCGYDWKADVGLDEDDYIEGDFDYTTDFDEWNELL